MNKMTLKQQRLILMINAENKKFIETIKINWVKLLFSFLRKLSCEAPRRFHELNSQVI